LETTLDNKRQLSTREKVLIHIRDESTCILCGKNVIEDKIKIHIDHIIPFSKGGKTSFENCVCMCEDCNLGKSNLLFDTSKILDEVKKRNEKIPQIRKKLLKSLKEEKKFQEDPIFTMDEEEFLEYAGLKIPKPESMHFRTEEEWDLYKKSPILESTYQIIDGEKRYIKNISFEEFKNITKNWEKDEMDFIQQMKQYDYIQYLSTLEYCSLDCLAGEKLQYYYQYLS